MNDALYWVWLQRCVGFAKRFKEITDYFGTPEAVFNASHEELKSLDFLCKRKKLRDIIEEHDLTEAEETVEICRKNRIKIVPFGSEKYPQRLLDIINPPMVLYVRGNADCLTDQLSVAVIGSRTPSVYGEESCRKIVTALVDDYGATVVSGGALGIDSVAHLTTMENHGKTVLVMGCGHGNGYLPENSELRKNVFAHHGALVSEYPPYWSVTQGSFPDRNRIISGLSKGVVIIEAAEISGTFSTAKHAQKQGRDLFVLPGDIDSGNFAGSNRLISEGAIPVFSADDILSHYGEAEKKRAFIGAKTNRPFETVTVQSEFSKKSKRKKRKKTVTADENVENITETEIKIENVKKNLPETVSKNAEMVYNLMSDGKCTLDELANCCELFPAKILAALTELELEGFIEKTSDAYRIV